MTVLSDFLQINMTMQMHLFRILKDGPTTSFAEHFMKATHSISHDLSASEMNAWILYVAMSTQKDCVGLTLNQWMCEIIESDPRCLAYLRKILCFQLSYSKDGPLANDVTLATMSCLLAIGRPCPLLTAECLSFMKMAYAYKRLVKSHSSRTLLDEAYIRTNKFTTMDISHKVVQVRSARSIALGSDGLEIIEH